MMGLGSITISNYQSNRPKTVLYPGDSTRQYEYDPLMRLKRLTAFDPGGNSLLDYSYDYDIIGNIQQKVTEQGTYTYGYDAVQRLTHVDVDVPGLDDESFSYDAVGNRQSASNVTGDILHNANNELERYGDIEYEYDENGNLTEVTLNDVLLFDYTYNANNRLIKVEGGNNNNTIAEYSYDPFGRRLWKDVGGERTYFFYSDEGLIAEYDEQGNEIRSYGYKPDSTWTTDPLWLKENGAYYWYQNDHLGTPQQLIDMNGTVVWSATYSAFGEAQIQIEAVASNLRFPGQYFDVETGLHYNFQRYYDSESSRYTQTDPIGFDGGDLNLYAYVWNNPVSWIDPLGLELKPMGTPEQIAIIEGHLWRLQKVSPNNAGELIRLLKENDDFYVEIRLKTGGFTRYDDLADPKRIDYNDQYCETLDPYHDPPWKNIPPEIALAHELIHALHDSEGVLCLTPLECLAPSLFTGADERLIGLKEWPEEY